jgi:hypothetical protein
MRLLARVACVFAVVSALNLAIAQNPDGEANDQAVQPIALDGLTPKQSETLIQIVGPAYFAGNLEVLGNAIPALLSSASEEQLDTIDQWSEANKIPPLEKLLAESRYWLAINNQSQRLSKLGPNELVSMLSYFREKLADIQSQYDEFPDVDEPVPKIENIIKYRDYLWDMHVFDNKLANHSLVALYAAKASKAISRKARKRLTDEQQDIIGTNFKKIAMTMKSNRDALHEAELEIRCRRLMYAVKALDVEDDPKERLMAAYAVAMDSEMLLGFFGDLERRKEKFEKLKSKRERRDIDENETVVFRRKLLNTPKLYARIQKESEKGYALGGELIEKSVLLFDGLRWWARGRYGSGPEAFGLLKSKQALMSGDAMTAISMPVVAPTPTVPGLEDDSYGGDTPDYDRRHLYIWSLDDRRFVTQSRTASTMTQEKLSERKTETETFF